MARRWDGRGGGSVARWLLPASLLHVVLAVLAGVLPASRDADRPASASAMAGSAVTANLVAAPPPAAPLVESLIELTLLHEDEAALPAGTERALSHDDELTLATGNELGTSSFAAARATSNPTRDAVLPSLERLDEATRRATDERASVSAALARGARPPDAAVEGRLEPEIEPAAPAAAPDAPASGSGRASSALSLEQLGIGSSLLMAMSGPFAAAPFVAATLDASALAGAPPTGALFPEAPLTEADRANQRLQASLRQPSLDAERLRGLSPEGPVIAAARRLVLGDETMVETSAVLNVRIDGGGRVTEVHVLEASSQNTAWQLIAARLMKDLGGMTLQRPGASQGWGLKLQLASALQLPSGAAPGLRTDVLGQVLPGSAAPGATSLSLSPTSPIQMEKPIDDIGRHMEQVMIVDLGLLKLHGDVADLASAARRVVRVAVLSVDETP